MESIKSKSNKSTTVVVISIAVVVITLITGVLYTKTKDQGVVVNATPGSKTINQKAKDGGYTMIEKHIGDEITLKTIKLTVTKLEVKDQFIDTFDNPVIAKEGTKFVVIDIDLTNITDAEFFFQPDFMISDQKGREYSDNLEMNTVLFPDVIISDTLKPAIKFSGKLYYLVPSDAEGFKLSAPKAGTKEIYRVNLN